MRFLHGRSDAPGTEGRAQGTANLAALQQISSRIIRAMTTMHRLESATSDPCAGGLLVTFPSGTRKVLAWRHQGDVDELGLAKDLAARALDSCLQEGRQGDANGTNWASFTAGALRIVRDWARARPASDSLPLVERVGGGDGGGPKLQ